MNKELKVLYIIFQLELAPTFEIVKGVVDSKGHLVNNKHSEVIAWYWYDDGCVGIIAPTSTSIIRKVESTFNIQTISDEEATTIAQHLFNWLKTNFIEPINELIFVNPNTKNIIRINPTN